MNKLKRPKKVTLEAIRKDLYQLHASEFIRYQTKYELARIGLTRHVLRITGPAKLEP